MHRRTFLRALATIAAATATTDLSAYLPPASAAVPPTIDWTQWNKIELTGVASGHIYGLINDVDVSAFPVLMRQLCRLIRVDEETGTVTFGGLVTYRVHSLGLKPPFTFSCRVALLEPEQLFDDIAIGPATLPVCLTGSRD